MQGAALACDRVHHVHVDHCLAVGVRSVGHSVTDHVLDEHLEHTAGLIVHEAGNALRATAPSQAAVGMLGDS